MRTSFHAGVALLAMLVPLAANALGITIIIDGQTVVFKDVSTSAWFATYVHDAAEAGIVNGYKDSSGRLTGKFGPENSVTFAEALKIASKSAGYDENAYGSVIDSGVKHWASPFVSVAKGEHFAILESPYRLDRPATRAEVASMFTSAFHVNVPLTPAGTTFKDVQLQTNYGAAVEALARDSVVSGDTNMKGEATGTYRPADSINRAEVVKIATGARAKYGMPGKDRKPSQQPVEANVVHYTSTGFSPSVLRLKAGTTVVFQNDSFDNLRVASDPHPIHTAYPGFDSASAIPTGQKYSFTFTRTGSWGYHNHLDPTRAGTIIVE